MMKRDEREKAESCWNKAYDSENLFILLERCAAMPATIRFWCSERIRLGLNGPTEAQISEALGQAQLIESHRAIGGKDAPTRP